MVQHQKPFTRRKARRGAAVVEFAFSAPILFLLVFGTVEFGRMIMVKHGFTNAAREGCRKAVLATTNDPNEVEAAVRRYLTGIASTDDVRIDVSSMGASGTEVSVDVRVNYSDISWVPFWPSEGELRATSTQKRE